MQDAPANLFTRDDTFFGVCQGLGEDLGINPNLLRLALPFPLFFFPVQTIAAYLIAGLFLLAVRLIVPVPRTAATPAEQAVASQPELLPLAA